MWKELLGGLGALGYLIPGVGPIAGTALTAAGAGMGGAFDRNKANADAKAELEKQRLAALHNSRLDTGAQAATPSSMPSTPVSGPAGITNVASTASELRDTGTGPEWRNKLLEGVFGSLGGALEAGLTKPPETPAPIRTAVAPMPSPSYLSKMAPTIPYAKQRSMQRRLSALQSLRGGA